VIVERYIARKKPTEAGAENAPAITAEDA